MLRRLTAGSRPEEIRKAAADLEAAEAGLHDAELTSVRVLNLAAQRASTLQSADNARAALDVARARKAAAQEVYALAKLGPREEDIAAARATLEADQAQLDLATKDMEDAELKAPADGVVEDRILEPGDMASPQKPILTLALDDYLNPGIATRRQRNQDINEQTRNSWFVPIHDGLHLSALAFMRRNNFKAYRNA